jgi:hypothetical protein
MSLLNTYSPRPWMVTEEKDIRRFYKRLEQGQAEGKKPPFSRYQVALVHGTSANWFVAVLVLTDAAGDDSEKIVADTKRWFLECGVEVDESESLSLRGETIEASLDHRYTIVKSFGTVGTPTVPRRKGARAGDKKKDAPAAPTYTEEQFKFWVWVYSLPFWPIVTLGTLVLALAAGLTWYLVKDGFTWWSVIPGAVALGALKMTTEFVEGARWGPTGQAYVSIVGFVGCSLLTIWLLSQDDFTWWVLLPGGIAVAALFGAIGLLIEVRDQQRRLR